MEYTSRGRAASNRAEGGSMVLASAIGPWTANGGPRMAGGGYRKAAKVTP
jgi:hypothetical protein